VRGLLVLVPEEARVDVVVQRRVLVRGVVAVDLVLVLR
jgi:hypothetical protein